MPNSLVISMCYSFFYKEGIFKRLSKNTEKGPSGNPSLNLQSHWVCSPDDLSPNANPDFAQLFSILRKLQQFP